MQGFLVSFSYAKIQKIDRIHKYIFLLTTIYYNRLGHVYVNTLWSIFWRKQGTTLSNIDGWERSQ